VVAEVEHHQKGATSVTLSKGWEILITRIFQQTRGKRVRTVGLYQVFHDGILTDIAGMTAESPGPGDNNHAGNRKCIEVGKYPLFTQKGDRYVTIGYKTKGGPRNLPKPGIELGGTGKRQEILIHPGVGFLASTGCINLSHPLQSGDRDIDFENSRKRVIAVIDDMKNFLGADFPKKNGCPIPNASVVIKQL
jgi:hypothetical protein